MGESWETIFSRSIRSRTATGELGESIRRASQQRPLQAARLELGWTQDQTIRALREAAVELHVTTAKASSLKTMLSRWENGRDMPDAVDQRLLCRAYGQGSAELGLVPAGTGPIVVPRITPPMGSEMVGYFRNVFAESEKACGRGPTTCAEIYGLCLARFGSARGVKTDRIDLAAIADLLMAGCGLPISVAGAAVVELAAWVAHRSRRVQVRTATKNQLLGQLDRAFPGLTLALSDVLGTRVGRLIAAHFADPARLAHLGIDRFRDFAARRGVQVNRRVADRLVRAARTALPTAEADVARQVLAADLALLDDLDAQISAAEARPHRSSNDVG